MISHMKAWWNNTRATYIGNAQAVRDFRSQLRGTRPLIFWGCYLAVLILTATISYGNFVREGQDFGGSQQALHAVYTVLMALLGIVISVAAPALTASAITNERQKKSLDLVACAPITTRYYLIGKMLSSFRYIWMLLILSLPVTSMCVVLGGATWGDVLSGYVLLSASGLIMTALCLLISSLFRTAIAALNAAYLFIAGAYLPVTFSLASMALARGKLEAPWYTGLSPLTVPFAAPTYSTLFGMAIPNYLLICAFSLLAVRYILLGTASVMGHYGSTDIRKFRQNTLIVLSLLSFGAISILRGYIPSELGNVQGLENWQVWAAQLAAPLGLGLMFLTSYLSVYSRSADERFRNDGAWNLRKIWIGTPSSALPYVLAMFLASFGVIGTYAFRNFGDTASAYVMAVAVWTLGGVGLSWLIARTVSLRNMTITQARTTSSLLLGAVFAVPSMILTLIGVAFPKLFESPELWKLSLISILAGRLDVTSIGSQLLLMAIASVICIRQLKAQPAPVTSNARATTTSGIPLPVADELLFGISLNADLADMEKAAMELHQRPNS